MTITRVEVDGVEFFTINATGKSGTSISGAARLNGVTQQSMSELIQNVGTGKVQSECLKPFLGKDMRVQVTFDRKEAHTQITWLQSEFVAAVTEYYAFESRHKTPEAVFSFRKFAAMGIERWIHSITGWEAPKPKHHEPLTHAEKLGIDPRYKAVTLNRHVIYNALLNKGINAQMYRVYLYLMDCELMQTRPSPSDICQHANVSKHSLYNLVERMRAYTLVPDWLVLDPSSRSLEAQIRDRLHHRLGGEVEVQTIHGPIDLLTATQIIEIKRIEDWKTGFGQVLAKAPAYPKHDKRLHLFGNSDRSFRNIKACCQEFAISVSFEKASLELV